MESIESSVSSIFNDHPQATRMPGFAQRVPARMRGPIDRLRHSPHFIVGERRIYAFANPPSWLAPLTHHPLYMSIDGYRFAPPILPR